MSTCREEGKLKALTSLRGVGIPMASAILTQPAVAPHEGAPYERQPAMAPYEMLPSGAPHDGAPYEMLPSGAPVETREHFRENLRLDTVVRLPHEDDPGCVPVGVVSKDYVLLPHTEVLDLAVQALEAAKINPADVRAELRISDLGERMALAFVLPDNLLFDPGDRFPMQMRLECLNSVDGSTRFRAEMGWFRLVCSNGLGFRVTTHEADRRHVGDLQLAHIGTVLGNGLRDYQSEREGIERWAHTGVSLKTIDGWADSTLRSSWGLKAATRARSHRLHRLRRPRAAAVQGTPADHRGDVGGRCRSRVTSVRRDPVRREPDTRVAGERAAGCPGAGGVAIAYP